jgi:drug/metabolite transporter (DMT)-like permease
VSALVIGLGLAALAATLYAVAVALQALEAREAPARERLHPKLVERLVSQPRWLVGTACALLAWGAQTAALAFAPLTLVQPTLALALVVLLAIGAYLMHERVGLREIAGVSAIVIGIAGLAWSSPAGGAAPEPSGILLVAIACFAAVAATPYLLRRHLHRRNWLITVAAGLGFAWAAQASKFVADAASSGAWLLLVAALVASAAGAALGLLNEMTALQQSEAVRVYPTVLVIQIVVAVLLAPVLLGESWAGTPLGGLAIAGSLAVVVGGAAGLSTAQAIGRASTAPSRA